MKFNAKKLLLLILKGLVFGKRVVVWSWNLLLSVFGKFEKLYQNTIGFRLYRLGFNWKRIFGRINVPWGNQLVEFLGQRGTLQVILFVVAFVVMIPHTTFSKQDNTVVAGRQTVLYALVGPGDEEVEIEEIVVDIKSLAQTETRSWREGSVVSEQTGSSGSSGVLNQIQEISGISAGGTAVTKPSILPDSKLPTLESGNIQTGRTEIVYHDVRPGDVIGSIAEKYGIDVNTILWANDLSVRSYIRPGDRLVILPVSGLVHKVKRGDTVAKIARTYDTEKDKIIKLNKLKNDGSDIVIGEELLIPEGKKPYVRSYVSTPRPTTFNKITAPSPSISSPAGSGYLWPTNVRRISQYYGWRHAGLDIAGPVGSPLYASRSGRVIKSQCGWNGGYGCYVIVDHGGGVHTLYAHASRLLVNVSEQVVQGQSIALMGSTGRSTGSHIHFEVRVNGRRQNPLKYVR